jgi:lipid-A-disaccharide synthase-like uncharacterized protein
MDDSALLAFPYTAITVSILARFIFFYLLYKNKSQNSYSLAFCVLNIGSSSLWVVYSLRMGDLAMVARSGVEIGLLFLSSAYILHNKWRARVAVAPTLPSISAGS